MSGWGRSSRQSRWSVQVRRAGYRLDAATSELLLLEFDELHEVVHVRWDVGWPVAQPLTTALRRHEVRGRHGQERAE